MRIRFSVIGVLVLMLLMVAPAVLPGAFSREASAAVVGSISVQGNVRVENDTILSYLPINPGDNVDDEEIDDAIKALFQTGLFRDVRISQRGSTLVVSVDENPLINIVNFEGNEEINDETLAKEVQVRERMIFTKSRVASDNRRIIELYQRQGFYNVTVTPKLIRLSDNRINLVFEVNEGGKTKVREITFEGNEAFSDGRLRDVVSTKSYSWFRFFSKATIYDESRVQVDRELLRRHYLKYGYADVDVGDADVQMTEDGEGFAITFRVTEGQRYEIADVAINIGDTNLEPGPLQRVVKTGSGDTFNQVRVDQTVEKMTLEAARQGFVFAKVEPKIDRSPGNGLLNLTYDISEGTRTYIERIDIVGNDRTLDHVIRRELLLFEGDAFNRALVERARRKLTALDFFSAIDFKEEQGSAPDKIVLVVAVTEKQTGSLRFSVGYSSAEQAIGSVSLSERNLFGRGYQAKIDASGSFKKQSLNLSFTDPYFMDLPLSAGIDLFANRSDAFAASAFESQQIGGALRTGFRLNDDTTVSLKYLVARREVKELDETTAAPAIIDQVGVDWKSAISATLVYDGLDDPINPTLGFKSTLQGEVAGLGGDAQYASIEASAWYFFPLLDERIVLKAEANAGHIQPFNDKVSVQDKFFKGGGSFRGFAAGGVGPRQVGNDGVVDPIGAQTYAIGTVEATFEIPFLPEALGMEGALFSDFGTVFGGGYETVPDTVDGCTFASGCTVFDSSKFRASVGFGLIWQSPIGPLRFDWAYPLLKQDGDVTENFSMSIGTRF